MALDICGSERIDTPTEQQIEEAVRGLTGKGDSFVILDRLPDVAGFIQAGGGPELFTVEYCIFDEAAGMEVQYQSVEDVPVDKVVQMFLDYHRGGTAYQTGAQWTEIDRRKVRTPEEREAMLSGPSPKRGCAGVLVLVIVLAAAAGMALLA